jgi:phosphate/phosphite/phosphonate ABC transporter binding protein
MMGLAWVFLWLSCSEPPEAVRGTIARTPAKQMYEQSVSAMRAANIEHLTWGVTPFITESGDVRTRYEPTVNLVSQRLSMPMKVIAGENYADIEALLLNHRIDIAVMSPYAYVVAKTKDPGIRVISTHIANGTESYGAYILVTENSPVRSIADLSGKKFGFVDERSSSGWLFPASRMLDEGLNPLTDLSGQFYGSHERVIRAIVSGKIDAGATYNAALSEGRGRIPGAHNLRVIARTERIPYDAYVIRSGFPTEAILGLQKALSSVSTRDADGREALEPLGDINGFIRTDDTHYKSVREVEARVQSLLALPGGTLPTLAEDIEEPQP